MTNDTNQSIEKKLDVIIELLRNLLALELSKRGLSQEMIRKRLHVAKATVEEMLQGVRKEK
jgi:predicted transcriptional regulator